MKRIIQEDGSGCGLACVAMVAGVTYAEARVFAVDYLDFDPLGPFYTEIIDLRYMLSEYGYGLSRYTPFKAYEYISPLAILEIERSGNHNHWVLYVKCGLDRYILDPAQGVKSERRRDWHRMRPVSYANVTRL